MTPYTHHSRYGARPRYEPERVPDEEAEPVIAYEGWAIVELVGKRVIAGYVRDEHIFGQHFLAIDVPAHRPFRSRYSPRAVFSFTEVDEIEAREMADRLRPGGLADDLEWNE